MCERFTDDDVPSTPGSADADTEVVIVVRGGVVQDVYAYLKEPQPLIWLVDWDNINDRRSGEAHGELIDPADISELHAEDRAQIDAEVSQWGENKYTEGRVARPYRH